MFEQYVVVIEDSPTTTSEPTLPVLEESSERHTEQNVTVQVNQPPLQTRIEMGNSVCKRQQMRDRQGDKMEKVKQCLLIVLWACLLGYKILQYVDNPYIRIAVISALVFTALNCFTTRPQGHQRSHFCVKILLKPKLSLYFSLTRRFFWGKNPDWFCHASPREICFLFPFALSFALRAQNQNQRPNKRKWMNDSFISSSSSSWFVCSFD